MTDRVKEQLSAFLDGELPDPESALLLKRLERDDDLRGALSRYSLIGAVLRTDGDVPAARQVAARVSAAIAREPRLGFVARGGALALIPALRAPAAGLGLAAGVAAAALLVAQQFGPGGPERPGLVAASGSVAAEAPVLQALVPAGSVVEIGSPPAYTTPLPGEGPGSLPEAQFANYLVAHSGYASPLLRRSLVTGLIVAPEPEEPAPAAPAARAEQR